MKKVLLFGLFLSFFTSIEAQEIRAEGRMLPNEIRVKRAPYHRKNYQKRDIFFSNSYAELWLRILGMGRFRVEVGNQAIENETGLYRFFDLNRGRQVLSIYDGRFLVYRTTVDLRDNRRLMLDFNENGLFLYDEVPLQGNGYEIFPQRIPNGMMYPLDNAEFERFFRSFNQKPFDKDKLELFYIKLRNSYFTSGQISRMVEAISFSESQLELAKAAYDHCIDPENYYQVAESMRFHSASNELKKYIMNRK